MIPAVVPSLLSEASEYTKPHGALEIPNNAPDKERSLTNGFAVRSEQLQLRSWIMWFVDRRRSKMYITSLTLVVRLVLVEVLLQKWKEGYV